MPTPDDVAREVRETLARVGLAETALGSVGATIGRPAGERGLRASGPSAPLPALPLDGGADLVPVREIGRGGMGVVHLAQQRSLGREVAVKTVRTLDAGVVRALLREASIMGALEHPNLVPVHALGVRADGSPVLVMKRIDGVSWRALLDDPTHDAWKPLLAGHSDRLRANLEVLGQICRALSFAHERGIIHRDLKPENVMIGRFGEVVLLDWGIALRLAERELEPDAIVGTPGYLAPEMARADARRMDERTDVYLLGATLFELLTGRLLHDAPSTIGALAAALVGEIPPMDGVPADLATLARRACSLDPNDRLASAEAFRAALVHHLATRDTEALVADARAALERARRAVATDGAASPTAARALVEARFGLTSAQRMRPEDPAIRQELDAAIHQAIEREIDLRSPEAARALAHDLDTVPTDLAGRIDALAAEVARERDAAAALVEARREADASAAVRPLTLLATVGSIIGTALGIWVAVGSFGSDERFPARAAMGIDVVGVVVGMTGFYLGRRALMRTAGTRRLAGFYAVWGWSLILSDALTYGLGRDAAEAGAHSLAASAFVAACAGVMAIPGVLPSVAGHLAGIGLIVSWPEHSALFVMPVLALDAALFVRAFRREASRTAPDERV